MNTETLAPSRGRLTLNGSRTATRTSNLRGKRAAVIVFSYYSMDPRPRRAAEALVREGMDVDVICLRESAGDRARETVDGVGVLRVPLRRRRGGAVGYVVQYLTFLLTCLAILAVRSVTRRYSLIHVHNMPDVLVLSGLVPKCLGARIILDLHDPMPELMTTIFGLAPNSVGVRLLRQIERASIRFADRALTVNQACRRLFVSRSCAAEKMQVVMNSPDEDIFPFRPVRLDGPGGWVPGTPFVVMYHGSLVERNGLDVAVEALSRVRTGAPEVRLRIYGSRTPFLDRVMESVRGTAVAEAIEYMGARRIEDIAAAIEECHLGVIPNRRNLFTELNTPTRIFEYLAMGKPVIAPRAVGIRDYFDEESLLFFELGNAADLARQIEYVVSHPRETVETVRRGQAVYRAHAWHRERAAFVQLVDDLLSHPSAGARRVPAGRPSEQS
jgi:glycosyltransferase involved in cell wall biosynthesis